MLMGDVWQAHPWPNYFIAMHTPVNCAPECPYREQTGHHHNQDERGDRNPLFAVELFYHSRLDTSLIDLYAMSEVSPGSCT